MGVVISRVDFELNDRKVCKNQFADHLSSLETYFVYSAERDIEEAFPDESFISVTHKIANHPSTLTLQTM